MFIMFVISCVGEIETDTTFSSLLEANKTLTLDPGLTTPPIRAITDHQPQKSGGLHSPPVQSLFQTSPTPEHQWLAGDVSCIYSTVLVTKLSLVTVKKMFVVPKKFLAVWKVTK